MIVTWFVPLGQARPITSALHALMADARTVHGCTGCFVSTGMRDQGTVQYVEEWASEEDLRLRLESDAFRALATLIEEATESPNVEFVLPEGTRGLEYVEEVRKSRRPSIAGGSL
jgi:quinol monooxygenase YgiN